MSVETVLEKIISHNSSIMGCIVRAEDRVYKQLPEMYGLMDCDEFSEHAEQAFDLADGLETERTPFDQMFLEFDSHSVYARRLDAGVLVLLGEPMERAHFRKMQVGVNLFMKPLARALEASDAPMADTAPGNDGPSKPDAPSDRKPRFYRGIRY